jgi:hypothetical protein
MEGDSCEWPRIKKLSRSGMRRFLSKMDRDRLKGFALWFMEDCYEACNISHYLNHLDADRVRYNYCLRQFRHQHAWLRHNLAGTDRFNKLSHADATIFYGVRSNPEDQNEQVAMIAHMGGEPTTLIPAKLLQLAPDEPGWEVAIASPGCAIAPERLHEPIELKDSQGLLLMQYPPAPKPEPIVAASTPTKVTTEEE